MEHPVFGRRSIGALPLDTTLPDDPFRIRKEGPAVVITPNLAMAAAHRNHSDGLPEFDRADLLLPDGIGIRLLARIAGLPPLPPTTGIDYAWSLLQRAARDGRRVFFLGGRPDIAFRAAKRCAKQLPGLCVVGWNDGYFDKTVGSLENQRVLEAIRSAGTELLLVCFGFPLQERWMLENRSALPCVRLCIGLGGSFDVWAGALRRAPEPIRRLRLEWLWRVLLEPRRIAGLLRTLRAVPGLLREAFAEKRHFQRNDTQEPEFPDP